MTFTRSWETAQKRGNLQPSIRITFESDSLCFKSSACNMAKWWCEGVRKSNPNHTHHMAGTRKWYIAANNRLVIDWCIIAFQPWWCACRWAICVCECRKIVFLLELSRTTRVFIDVVCQFGLCSYGKKRFQGNEITLFCEWESCESERMTRFIVDIDHFTITSNLPRWFLMPIAYSRIAYNNGKILREL